MEKNFNLFFKDNNRRVQFVRTQCTSKQNANIIRDNKVNPMLTLNPIKEASEIVDYATQQDMEPTTATGTNMEAT